MKLTVDQVRHVAALARLSLSNAETERAQQQLTAILEAFATLAEVDTSSVQGEESVSAAHADRHARGDVVGEPLGLAALERNAPQMVGTSFALPRVIE